MSKKAIYLSIEEACDLYSKTTDEAFKKMLESNFGKENLILYPSSWDELKNISGYYIESNCEIRIIRNIPTKDSDNWNVATTKEICNSQIAMSMLSQLMLKYNGDWKPDWTSGQEEKHTIFRHGKTNEILIDYTWYRVCFLAFKTKEIARKFAENHKDLILAYYSY